MLNSNNVYIMIVNVCNILVTFRKPYVFYMFTRKNVGCKIHQLFYNWFNVTKVFNLP